MSYTSRCSSSITSPTSSNNSESTHLTPDPSAIVYLLMTKTLNWAMAVWNKGRESLSLYTHFIDLFNSVFDYSLEGKEVGEQLPVKRGGKGATDYVLEFRMLVAGSSWNKPALKAVFHQGLTVDILTELACRVDQAFLE